MTVRALELPVEISTWEPFSLRTVNFSNPILILVALVNFSALPALQANDPRACEAIFFGGCLKPMIETRSFLYSLLSLLYASH